MLEEIQISDLGIIKSARLPFTQGLNVITGETGAGKTMVLSALHLLLGKRASNNMIHKDATMLSVEGCWNLENSNYVKDIEDTGAVIEDDQLYINRTVKSDGKSRAVVGGKTTPASILSGIGNNLVSIHGQSDQIRLKNTTAQREALDKYAGEKLTKELLKYAKSFKNWNTKQKHLNDVINNSSSRKREINSLKKFIEDFDKLSPQENEDNELTQQINALSNIDNIRENVTEAFETVSPSNEEIPSMSEQLSNLIRSLSMVIQHDPELEAIHEKATNLSDELDEVIKSVETYLQNLDEDSIEQLYSAQERQIEIKSLVRKYGNTLDEIIEQRDKAESDLSDLESYDQPVEELQEELDEAFKELSTNADKVTDLRTKAALKMEEAVNAELKGLAMGGTSLKIQMNKVKISTNGQDEIEIMLLAKGAKVANPIAKSASGGELSRIMLALEVVLADPKNTGTFVFDEVDSGVGGETAIEIGKRLALLAKEAQVIVVTHLPQVAAYGNNHLVVSKAVTEDDTETSVHQLSSDERVDEIARMLSGMSESESGKAHAVDLIEHARKFIES